MDPDFLTGGGDMGALMRAHDWRSTALGDPATWPENLRSTLGLCLHSAFPIAIYWGPELTLLYNDAWRPILGDKHPQALGRPGREVWPEIWDAIDPVFRQVIDTGTGVFIHDGMLAMKRFGYVEECYFDYTFNPIRQQGATAGIFNVVVETTYRVIAERRAQAQRDFAAALVPATSSSHAMALAAEALASMSHDVPFALLYRLQDDTAILEHAVGAEAGSTAAPRHFTFKAGAPWPLPDSALPGAPWPEPVRETVVLPISLEPGGRPQALLVAAVSPRRALDLDYRGFYDSLATHLGRAMGSAEAYEAARRRAEALAEIDRAKTTFFSNVSHEFRTPLTLMLGPLDDLLEQPDLPHRDSLEVVHRNGQRLLKLVNTLLDFARIEAGRAQAHYEPTDLAAFTADLASNFRSACERAGLALEVECPSLPQLAYVDREMWEKVVLNLLSNAFKFTLEGGITVRLRESQGEFVLEVADTGVGIPQAEIPNLFERFRRVEGTRGRSHEGSGIGLALVRELVKLHGGSIAAASGPQGGTTFTVRIPEGSAHLPAQEVRSRGTGSQPTARAGAYVQEALGWLSSAPEAEPVAATQGLRRVLLADDNADLREYARRLLSQQYDVEVAVDGEAALAAARERRPDLIVSDVMMPGLDGFGLIAALRSDAALREIPVILLSARAGEEARLEGLQKGADDYLVKPFSGRELLVRVGSLLHSVDIRREALDAVRSSEQRLSTTLSSISDAVTTLDAQWRITGLNAAARARLGDCLGKVIWEELPAAVGNEAYVQQHRAMKERIQVEYEVFYAPWERWFAERVYPTADGGLTIYSLDVTDRKRSEQVLRDADRAKDEFLATLAHELRNPLAPIRTGLELLGHAGIDSRVGERALAMMGRQVEHMVRLVDDLLDVSRITRGKLELRKSCLDLREAVRQGLEASRPHIDAAAHALELELPEPAVWVDADLTRIAQAVSNLLNNAARYTPHGGSIALRCRLEKDGYAAVEVSDTGVGMAADVLPRMFEMFVRGSESPGGLGIGLTLARRIAEMHGGTLEGHSDGPGKGSRFVLRVPLAVRPARTEAALAHTGPPGMRILVVDDNRDAAVTLAALLEATGHEARVAHDGDEALRAAAEFAPQAILLDLGMPGMDGYETCRKLRRTVSDGAVRIVALTGWGQESDRSRTRAAGFDAHLVKPAQLSEIERAIGPLGAPRGYTARRKTSV